MSAKAFQISGVSIVCSTVCSGERKHQSSALLAFLRGTTGDWWIPFTKGQWRGKCCHLMTSSSKQDTQEKSGYAFKVNSQVVIGSHNTWLVACSWRSHCMNTFFCYFILCPFYLLVLTATITIYNWATWYNFFLLFLPLFFFIFLSPSAAITIENIL